MWLIKKYDYVYWNYIVFFDEMIILYGIFGVVGGVSVFGYCGGCVCDWVFLIVVLYFVLEVCWVIVCIFWNVG